MNRNLKEKGAETGAGPRAAQAGAGRKAGGFQTAAPRGIIATSLSPIQVVA
jgi:hypothetical protein